MHRFFKCHHSNKISSADNAVAPQMVQAFSLTTLEITRIGSQPQHAAGGRRVTEFKIPRPASSGPGALEELDEITPENAFDVVR